MTTMGEERQFVYDSCITGYHVFKKIWNPTLGQELVCEPEFGNIHDAYAVAIRYRASTGDLETVAHVPRIISAPSCLFIRRSGVVTCQGRGDLWRYLNNAMSIFKITCNFNETTPYRFKNEIFAIFNFAFL